LLAVNRGFATTSVQSKKAKENEASTKSTEQQEGSVAPHGGSQSQNKATGEPVVQDGQAPSDSTVAPPTSGGDDWDSEQAIDDAIYQGLVDRLQEKADKEVSRVIKVCLTPVGMDADWQSLDQEKRWADSFPRLLINDNIRDQVLQYAQKDLNGDDSGPKFWPPASSTNDSDKVLLRTYVTFQVLSRLGFSDPRIEECIVNGLGDGQGWAEGEEWVRSSLFRC
jgi:ATP-dependent RNA helicase DHX29